MNLSPGTHLGRYVVVAPIGAGGMGEVYRARDERLERDVAIKVLPPEFASDEGRLRRFTQEAQSAGGLNHPNVLTVHDVGTHEGAPYLVSELLEGESLRDRLASTGRLPPRKACEYAAQAARGLGAAHARGIVHRDLKPDNLFVTRDDRVKILDFGLAKLTEDPLVSADDETMTMKQETEPGVILGTVGYMAPEQVRGEASDNRADIFALGTVLYEMLTGERAFTGDSAVSALNSILVDEPPEPSARVPGVTKAHDEVVRHCLEKGVEQRFQSAQDLAFQLEMLSGAASTSQVSGETIDAIEPIIEGRRRGWLVGLAMLGSLALGAVVGWMLQPEAPEARRPPLLETITFSGVDRQPAVSPDGRTLAYVSVRDSVPKIWLKRLPGLDEVGLTDGPDSSPRFSPDGSEILFIRDGSLYRLPVLGGAPRLMADNASLADWTPHGDRIAFARIANEGSDVLVMAADGSDERLIHQEPLRMIINLVWSPDGETLAAPFVQPGANVTDPRILMIDVDSGESWMLEAPLGNGQPVAAVWSGDGDTLVYAQSLTQTPIAGQNILVRHHLASDTAEILTYIDGIIWGADVLDEGRAVVGIDVGRGALQEVLLDGTQASERWLTQGNSLDRQPIYSPDGEWLAFSTNRFGNLDIYSVHLETGEVRRLTDHEGTDWDPYFTPDGEKLIWSSDREGHFEVWMAEADGRSPRRLTDDGHDAENGSLTPDGDWLVYNSAHPEKSGVWKQNLETGETMQLVAGLTGVPEISPDGRYVLVVKAITLGRSTIEVVRIEDGAPAPFDIHCIFDAAIAGSLLIGRSRWLPDGSGIAFVCEDDEGRPGVFAQDFVPGEDTRSTRRALVTYEDGIPESFGLSPDGRHITVSLADLQQSLVLVDHLPGVSRPRRGEP